MDKEAVLAFKGACRQFLRSYTLTTLRIYGRSLQITTTTEATKGDLIEDILAVLCGETYFIRNNRGAPVKNDELPVGLEETVETLKKLYFGEERASIIPPLECCNTEKWQAIGIRQRIDEAGRLTIPEEIRRLLGVGANDFVEEKPYRDEHGNCILLLKKHKSND